ncbi:hypothetical protein LCGC14_1780180 [marine sediment metagenome]|uniref:HNH domain-containing protein n=1 Tax=marine sediment metagenome TaxID=412755 RepID=A0A0F9HIA8_9ZZZZ
MKGRCRECGKPVPPGRRSWCGQDCVDAHRLRTDPNFQRLTVFNRDRGVCAECGRDCVALRNDLRPLTSWGSVAATLMSLVKELGGLPDWWRDRYPDFDADKIEHAIKVADELGLLKHVMTRCSMWDMDHVVPLWSGGTNDLPNLRSLCVSCHREATRIGAAERAAMKRCE